MRYSDTEVEALVAEITGGDDPTDTTSRVEDRRNALTAQLVDATELHRLPRPEALVADLIDRDSLCWLQGKPGHAKSFIALDLAGHVATGRPWRGRDVVQGRVLYIVAEGAFGMEQRLHAWRIGNKARVAHGTITFLPVAVQLLDHLDVAALRLVVADVEPVLIVIDTQARVTLGGDENSSKDMGRFVDAADQLRLVCRSTILVVHHEARNGENLRGSTAMEGAASTVIRAKKDGALIEMSCVKQKDRAEFDPIYGTLAPAGTSAYWSHEAVGLMQAETDTENKLYEVMRDLYGTSGASTTTLKEATGLAKSSFHRALNSLVRKEIIRNTARSPRTFWVLCDQDEKLPET